MKNIKNKFNAPAILTFIMIYFIATLLGVVSKGRITQIVFMTYHSSLTNPMTYVRFITHIFGHSGWSHFIGNASYLLLLGPMLEEKYGSKELIEVIGITAIATGLVNYIFFGTWDYVVRVELCLLILYLRRLQASKKERFL